MIKRGLVSVFLLGAVLGANAQLSSIGPFSGTYFESWETQTPFQFLNQYSAFGGNATVNDLSGGANLHITTGWSFFNSLSPFDGTHLMGGAGANYYFLFNTPADKFGGYWGTIADVPGATAKFYDVNNNQIDVTQSIASPLGQWQWNGWQSTVPIKKVEIYANNSFGGFIMSDALQYTPNAVPEPTTWVVFALGGLALTRLRRRK